MIKQVLNIKRILLLLFYVLSLQWVTGQEIKVKTSVDSTSIKIGDQIKYQIQIEQPENAKLQFPAISGKLTEAIEIVEAIKPDTLKKDKILKINYKFIITCFDSGSFTIPSLSLPYTLGNIKDTLKTDSLFISVMNLPVDTTTQVLDIKPPMKAPINFKEALPYIFGFWILALIAVLIWMLISRHKKKGFFFESKPQDPPHIIALRELDSLRTQKLWQSNRVKEYYVNLTEIVRKYIEKRFDIMALEMTTDEIVDAFKYNNFVDPESKNLIKDLFTLADLVKFAKAQPLPDENEVSLLNAYQFVNNTKISEPVAATEDNKETDLNTDLKK